MQCLKIEFYRAIEFHVADMDHLRMRKVELDYGSLNHTLSILCIEISK